MENQEKYASLRLANAKGINNADKIRLIAHCGSVQAVFNTPLETLKTRLKIPITRLKRAFEIVDQAKYELQFSLLKANNIDILLATMPNYPERLKQIDDAPAVLFVRGDVSLLYGPQLAMVGSRKASPSGLKTAQAFAAQFAKSGLSITSGLALGIDSAAHQGALQQIGRTIAVVATGLDEVYPRQNQDLAIKIIEQGAMVSEFAPLTPPRREHFPRRNRLISGLSLGVLVVEADTRSGSLITARVGAEQGKEVFAIPGSIHSPTSRGCHQLIRQGAKLVETTADVFHELEPALNQAILKMASETQTMLNSSNMEINDGSMNKDALAVLKQVDFAPTAIDDIVKHSNLSVDLVSSILLQLELAEKVLPVAGGQYQRIQQ